MNIDSIYSEIKARVSHLSELRQPGAVDLGPADNERNQDELFYELHLLEKIEALLADDLE